MTPGRAWSTAARALAGQRATRVSGAQAPEEWINRRTFVFGTVGAFVSETVSRTADAGGRRSLRVGSARVDVLTVGDITLPLSPVMRTPGDATATDRRAVQDAVRDHRIMPMQDVLIRSGETTLLVDIGTHDIAHDSPYAVPGYAPPPTIPEQLRRAGVESDAVRHVVITHRHWDHFNGAVAGGRPVFPRAAHYIQRADWLHISERMRQPDTREAQVFGALARHGLLRILDGDHPVAPGLDIIAAPGETPGHQVVRVRSMDRELWCVGDLLHHRIELSHPGFMVDWADESSNRSSRARIYREGRASRAVLIASHVRETLELT